MLYQQTFTYTVKHVFRCIFMLQFWNVDIPVHFNLMFSECSLFTKLNFYGYLVLQFYPTCKIRENFMHAKNNMVYSICFARIADV